MSPRTVLDAVSKRKFVAPTREEVGETREDCTVRSFITLSFIKY
jgi:hypothetical protein